MISAWGIEHGDQVSKGLMGTRLGGAYLKADAEKVGRAVKRVGRAVNPANARDTRRGGGELKYTIDRLRGR